jgi:hypothetical protein
MKRQIWSWANPRGALKSPALEQTEEIWGPDPQSQSQPPPTSKVYKQSGRSPHLLDQSYRNFFARTWEFILSY